MRAGRDRLILTPMTRGTSSWHCKSQNNRIKREGNKSHQQMERFLNIRSRVATISECSPYLYHSKNAPRRGNPIESNYFGKLSCLSRAMKFQTNLANPLVILIWTNDTKPWRDNNVVKWKNLYQPWQSIKDCIHHP
jgi:hypothetical protein